MTRFLVENAASPGHSSHTLAQAASATVADTRARLARLINAEHPDRIGFCHNATYALNVALGGTLETGRHVITTEAEHNSVLRPLTLLARDRDVEVTVVSVNREGMVDEDEVAAAIRPTTQLIAVTHASNVTGTIMPIENIAAIARRHGVWLLIDATQSAGHLPIDVQSMGISLLALTGHKGLLGPTGTGALYVRRGVQLRPSFTGGTGTKSDSLDPPSEMPELVEAGTLNGVGIAGLGAGLRFIEETGMHRIRQHEQELTAALLDGLRSVPGVVIYGTGDPARSVGVVSFTVAGYSPSELGHLIDKRFGVMCRVGLHCAPLVHRAIGSAPAGTVRASVGPLSTRADVERLVRAVRAVLEPAFREALQVVV